MTAAAASVAATKSMHGAAAPTREAEYAEEPIRRQKVPVPLPRPRWQKARPAAKLRRRAEDGAAPPPKKMRTKSSNDCEGVGQGDEGTADECDHEYDDAVPGYL